MSSTNIQSKQAPPYRGFKRDQCVWTYYFLVGLNCYITAALGPLMPFLQSELHMDYKVAGMHFTAFAVGTMLAGMTGDAVTHRLRRMLTLQSSLVTAVIGMLCLITAQSPIVSIFGILLTGYCASLTYQTLAATISDHLEELRTFALMEGEVFAMLFAGLAPFAVGACVSLNLGWRAAIILLIAMFFISFPFLRKFREIKDSHDQKKLTSGKLTTAFWLFGSVIALSCAAEWSTAFWSATYLCTRLSMSKAEAAAAVGAFFIGMVVGRFGGSRLVHYFSSSRLLFFSGCISIVGFLLLWLGQLPVVNVSGLFLTGLGIANMYPLAFSTAITISPTVRTKAIARVSLLAGTAILIAPLILSFIADRHGLFTAYFTIATVLILCMGTIIAANATVERHCQSLDNL